MYRNLNSDVIKTIDWHFNRLSDVDKIIASVEKKHNKTLEPQVFYFFNEEFLNKNLIQFFFSKFITTRENLIRIENII